jgi:hypothetical protein
MVIFHHDLFPDKVATVVVDKPRWIDIFGNGINSSASPRKPYTQARKNHPL